MRGRMRSGFSLIELLLVMAIIVVLLALLTPVFLHALEQTRGLAEK